MPPRERKPSTPGMLNGDIGEVHNTVSASMVGGGVGTVCTGVGAASHRTSGGPDASMARGVSQDANCNLALIVKY